MAEYVEVEPDDAFTAGDGLYGAVVDVENVLVFYSVASQLVHFLFEFDDGINGCVDICVREFLFFIPIKRAIIEHFVHSFLEILCEIIFYHIIFLETCDA